MIDQQFLKTSLSIQRCPDVQLCPDVQFCPDITTDVPIIFRCPPLCDNISKLNTQMKRGYATNPDTTQPVTTLNADVPPSPKCSRDPNTTCRQLQQLPHMLKIQCTHSPKMIEPRTRPDSGGTPFRVELLTIEI